MGPFTKTIVALLIGIFSAAFAVIFQNDIAALVGRAPVMAEVTVGAWYPHFEIEKKPNLFSKHDNSSIDDFADDKDVRFLRMRVINRSGAEIPNVYLTSDEDWSKFDAVVLRKQDNDTVVRDIYSGAERKLDLGAVDPASSIIVYIWSNRTFGYPFDLDDIKIVTSNGQVPTSVNRISGDATSYVFGIHTETIAWGLFFLCIIMAIILAVIIAHYAQFIKLLLSSDDYYLEQREVFDPNPDKFEVPGKLPPAR